MSWTAAGSFNRRIAVDEPVSTQDAETGAEIVDFEESFQTWAYVAPLSAREVLNAGGIFAEADTRIRIRWSIRNTAITAKWRLRYGDTIYNISGPPADIGTVHREIEMICKSGVNQG